MIKVAGRFSFYSCTGGHHTYVYNVYPGIINTKDPKVPEITLKASQRLDPGEAIWVPAGQIHAYVSGDCVEVGRTLG